MKKAATSREKILNSTDILSSSLPVEHLSFQEKQQLFCTDTFTSHFLNQSDNIAKKTKQSLKQSEALMNQWLDEGRAIDALVHGRAWLLDQVTCCLWQHTVEKQHSSSAKNTLALFAVGGYGRGELHPHSDIDLLILSEQPLKGKAASAVEHFITLLWDIGLRVGTSVRSLEDCSSLATKDITIFTSLMEARFLSGDRQLIKKLESRISPSTMWSSNHYLQAKYAEQKQRHRKYNQTSYNLEPDLKEAPGGLRDIHLILWITQRHYGKSNLGHLVKLGFLLPEENQQLQSARNFLWRVRWALHVLSKRPEERLLFDHQKTLSNYFGYKDNEDSLAIEQFMKSYFRAATHIATMKELLIQHFHDEIITTATYDNITPINTRFQLRNHYIEITHPDVFKQTPSSIFEMFVLVTHNMSILGARSSTIRALRTNLHLIDASFRKKPEVTQLFIKLLKAPYGLSAALRKMARYGILGRYLPEFAKITGQMQYDLFHTYTVEAHTLLLIKFLRRFRYTSHKNVFPLAYKANASLPSHELLYIAALYHDIAKGRGGDHSELGAIDAEAFCKNHNINRHDTDLVLWLVKHHLKLSITAQRQDLSDSAILHKFAAFVGSIERLNYLYCLTVADINATNPKLWNNWRATLLNTLYTESHRILLSGECPVPTKQQRYAFQKQNALDYLSTKQINTYKIAALWQKIDHGYFLRYTPEEIAWHTEHLLNHKNDEEPLVIAKTVQNLHPGGTAIFIYAPHTTTIFASVTLILERLNFNIMDAKVMTSHQHCMDTFIVLEADNTTIPEGSPRIRKVCQTLKRGLIDPLKIKRTHQRRTPRLLRYFRQQPKIRFSEDAKNQRTIMEVFAIDRPGLLAVIVDTLSTYNIHVQNAKILTLGERVEDVFFISTSDGQSISDSDILEQLHDALTKRLITHTEKDCYPM